MSPTPLSLTENKLNFHPKGERQREIIMAGEYDRERELKQFDDSKLGVKGLVDSQIQKIPHIFVHDQLITNYEDSKFSGDDDVVVVPTIDFRGIHENKVVRSETIKKIREACESLGFFQIVNHGIPVTVMDEMIAGVRRFHEQDDEEKKPLYSRDVTKKLYYNSNFDLYKASAANWRDTLYSVLAPDSHEPEELPSLCRDILLEYSKYIRKLGSTIFELLSEALGLNPSSLTDIDCAEGLYLVGHYYPGCPEPELTLGTTAHADNGFLTLLIQDHIGGLQILHGNNQWVDVPPLHGAMVVNIGDLLQASKSVISRSKCSNTNIYIYCRILMFFFSPGVLPSNLTSQLITNGKFKSVYHRVLAKKEGPRISVASFFRTHFQEGNKERVYGPIKELLSEENSPVYEETTIRNYLSLYYKKGLGERAISYFKLHK